MRWCVARAFGLRDQSIREAGKAYRRPSWRGVSSDGEGVYSGYRILYQIFTRPAPRCAKYVGGALAIFPYVGLW